jgi:hypothetical protein
MYRCALDGDIRGKGNIHGIQIKKEYANDALIKESVEILHSLNNLYLLFARFQV